MTATTWRALYDEARTRLGSDLDARRIVERASGAAGADFYVTLDEVVSARAHGFYADMVERRHHGEPLQYVVGVWSFRLLELVVDRRVLIPRPETEVVVDVAMAELGRLRPTPAAPATVVDLGTGSGAIALSFARELLGVEVWGTDRSPGALAVARANLSGLGRDARHVRLVEGSWFEALPSTLRGRVDLMVTNPPYVPADERLPDEVVQWEPVDALRAGPEGLDDIRHIVAGAPQWLARPGALVLELSPEQAPAAVDLAMRAGFDTAEVHPDLSGRPRALVARAGVAA